MKMDKEYWNKAIDLAQRFHGSPHKIERMPTIMEWLNAPIHPVIKEKLRLLLNDPTLRQALSGLVKDTLYRTMRKDKALGVIYDDLSMYIVGALQLGMTIPTKSRPAINEDSKRVLSNTLKRAIELPRELEFFERGAIEAGGANFRLIKQDGKLLIKEASGVFDVSEKLRALTEGLKQVKAYVSAYKISKPPVRKRKATAHRLAALLMSYFTTQMKSPQIPLVSEILNLCDVPLSRDALRQVHYPQLKSISQ